MSKVAIVGCGAMGSVYAGLMQLAGHEVRGECLWPDHVEAGVNAHGLRVRGASGDHTVRLAAMATTTDGIGICDLVIIAAKAFDVEAAAESCPPSDRPGNGDPVDPERARLPRRGSQGSSGRTGSRSVWSAGSAPPCPEPGVAHHNGMEMVRFGVLPVAVTAPSLEASAEVDLLRVRGQALRGHRPDGLGEVHHERRVLRDHLRGPG